MKLTGATIVALSSMFQTAHAGETPNVDWGGKMYAHWGLDVSDMGTDSEESPAQEFEVDRLYLTAKSDITDEVSIRVTTDAGRTDDAKLELFLKYAYIETAVNSDIKVRLGAAATPWIGKTEKFWGHRFVAKSFTDSQNLLSSSDLGVHAEGGHKGGLITWQAGLMNGEGSGSLDDDPAKSAQARVSVDPLASNEGQKLPISLFVAQDLFNLADDDPSTMFAGGTGWSGGPAVIWFEGVMEKEGERTGQGYSATAVAKVPKVANLFFRLDNFDPDIETESDLRTAMLGGVSRQFVKGVLGALSVEHSSSETVDENGRSDTECETGVFARMEARF